MKPKDYERKYTNNFDLLTITEDLTEDYRDYLKLHEGKMTTIRFRNGAKEIFDKIKNVARRLDLSQEMYGTLAKYFYAKIILPSHKLYWSDDREYQRQALDERRALEHAARQKQVSAFEETKNQNNIQRRGSVVRPQHFSNHGCPSWKTYTHNSRTYGSAPWYETASFYTWLSEALDLPFSIERDVVLSESTAEEVYRKNQESILSSYPPRIVEAADFLGFLDDLKDLSVTQIKTQYRTLSKVHHPDLGGSTEAFIKLTKYVDTLVEFFQAA